VEDLRGLSDAQLASDRMTREPLNLEFIVRSAVAGFGARMALRDLTWEIAAPGDEFVVEGDAGRLSQIVSNIVDNAIRYAGSGSMIRVDLVRRGACVRVAVHNAGESIDDTALPHIFQRFFRADPSRTRGSGGAGIGLAIVKELAAAHAGDVGADNDGDGVTVWFELPLKTPTGGESLAQIHHAPSATHDAPARA
jgi:two-component system sensor histidine kinase BaeS